MKKYEGQHTAILTGRAFYTILTICALIIAISGYVIYRDVSATPEAPLPAVAAMPVTQMPDLAEDTPVLAETEVPTVPTADPENPPAPAITVTAPIYVRPTGGAVLTPFSGDTLLYQPTFGDWRVHTGTDFAAESGENVLALTTGVVQEVYDDALYGTTVTLLHDADLTTCYSGLDTVRVRPGDSVEAGEALGTCAGGIDAEASLGTHVHLEARRGETAIDVLELLGEDVTE